MLVFAEIPIAVSFSVIDRAGPGTQSQPNQGAATVAKIRNVWLRENGRSAKMTAHNRDASAKIVGKFATARPVNRSGQGK